MKSLTIKDFIEQMESFIIKYVGNFKRAAKLSDKNRANHGV